MGKMGEFSELRGWASALGIGSLDTELSKLCRRRATFLNLSSLRKW